MSEPTQQPSDIPAALIAEARRLDAGATKGPWDVRPKPHDDWGMIRGADGKPVADTAMNARCREFRDSDEALRDGALWAAGPPEVAANARLIARYRTLCPELAGECERLMTEVESLRAELSRLRPGDDGTLLSEAWFLSLGFLWKQGASGPVLEWMGVGFYFCENSKTWRVEGEHWEIERRGQVRMFYQALGIDLKEQK